MAFFGSGDFFSIMCLGKIQLSTICNFLFFSLPIRQTSKLGSEIALFIKIIQQFNPCLDKA